MSNENITLVMQRLLKRKITSGHPGMCDKKLFTEEDTEEMIKRRTDLQFLKQSYKKPRYVMRPTKKWLQEIDVTCPKYQKDKEDVRRMAREGRRGLVQLFNTIQSQQKDFSIKLDNAGQSETKKEKILGSVTPAEFEKKLQRMGVKKMIKKEVIME